MSAHHKANACEKKLCTKPPSPPGKRTETYVRFTVTEFKTRSRNHKMSFKHENKRNDTELGKHLWQLKEGRICNFVENGDSKQTQ